MTELAKIPVLRPHTNAVIALPFFADIRDVVVVPMPAVGALAGPLHNLQVEAARLRGLVDSLVTLESDTALAVGLPNAESVEEIFHALGMSYTFLAWFKDIPVGASETLFGTPRFGGLDVGSNWFTVIMQHKDELLFIGQFIAGTATVADKIGNFRRLFGNRDEKARKEIEAKVTLEEAIKIAATAAPQASDPDKHRIAEAITAYNGNITINQTIVIVPSLNSPQDVQKLFAEAAKQRAAVEALPALNGEKPPESLRPRRVTRTTRARTPETSSAAL